MYKIMNTKIFVLILSVSALFLTESRADFADQVSYASLITSANQDIDTTSATSYSGKYIASSEFREVCNKDEFLLALSDKEVSKIFAKGDVRNIGDQEFNEALKTSGGKEILLSVVPHEIDAIHENLYSKLLVAQDKGVVDISIIGKMEKDTVGDIHGEDVSVDFNEFNNARPAVESETGDNGSEYNATLQNTIAACIAMANQGVTKSIAGYFFLFIPQRYTNEDADVAYKVYDSVTRKWYICWFSRTFRGNPDPLKTSTI